MSDITLTIDWLEDVYECDDCGVRYAQGAHVRFSDGREILLEPRAHCFDGVSYSEAEVYHSVLKLLGFDLVELHHAAD